jgi:hypothetical protein
VSDLSPDAQLSRACELVVTPRGPDLYVPDALARRLLAEGEQRIRDLDSDIVREYIGEQAVTEALIAVEQELRERMQLIERFARSYAEASCENCEGDGIDAEGGEWTLCGCCKDNLEVGEASKRAEA